MAKKKTTRKKTGARSRTTTRSRAPKRRLITPEDITRFQIVSAARVSPDGERVVFVHKQVGEKNEHRSNLWMVDADGKSPARQFTSGGRDRAPAWSPDGSTIAFIGARNKHQPQIFTMAVDGGEATALTSLPEGSIGTVKWSPDGRTIAFAYREQDPDWTQAAIKDRKENGLHDPPRVLDHWWYRLDGDGYFNAQRYRLHIVDVETGAQRVIFGKDTLGFFTFDFAPDSRRMVIGTNRQKRAGLQSWNDDIVILDLRTGKTRLVPNLPKGPKDQVAWSPDGRHIAYAGREGTDSTYSTENLELWVCDPQYGRARCLTAKTDYCLMAAALTDTAEAAFEAVLRWSPDSKRVFMKIGWHGESHVASIPARGGPIQFHTSGATDHDLGNLSDDGRTVALTATTTTTLTEVLVGRFASRSFRMSAATGLRMTRLTSFNRALMSELELSKPTSHWVTAEDGTRVQTWVMKPPRFKTGRRYPTILEVHGGPHAQYGVGFFHEFQVLAAAGYVVVYSNPRGSKGYGRDHCHAIRGDWGGRDWDDVQAVTRFMRSLPFVSRTRIGIMGGSYGGYMTNWAIGHSDEYKAAITDRCVSNLVSMGGSSDFVDPPDSYFPGNFWDRPEARWKCSPIQYMGTTKTPTLIIHSEGDLRCNVEQAEQVFMLLNLRNVPTRFVRYPRSTSHGMSRSGPPDMRLHRLHQILGWWKQYL